jgi:hypothetical protein
MTQSFAPIPDMKNAIAKTSVTQEFFIDPPPTAGCQRLVVTIHGEQRILDACAGAAAATMRWSTRAEAKATIEWTTIKCDVGFRSGVVNALAFLRNRVADGRMQRGHRRLANVPSDVANTALRIMCAPVDDVGKRGKLIDQPTNPWLPLRTFR